MKNLRLVPGAALLLLSGLIITPGCNGDNDTRKRDTGYPEDTYVFGEDKDLDGWTVADGDCDDEDPEVYPFRDELCNGIDDNCNGLIDEGFPDTDGDGIADCVAEEICDGIDNNGNGLVDEGFPDSNGDGIADCVTEEICDGIDNNGDGRIDEGFDVDRDGYTQCGTDEIPADCDDNDPTINPGVDEVLGDGVDNNCNGLIDEGEWQEGDLVIVEVLPNPDAVSDTNGEWVELYNSSDRVVYLNGLVISSTVDSDYHVVTSSTALSLDPGGVFVMGLNSDQRYNGGVELDYQYTDVVLMNSEDDIVISIDNVPQDQVGWDAGGSMPNRGGYSMSLNPAHFSAEDNDDPSNWCEGAEQWGFGTDYGTPGEQNPSCF